MKPYKLILTLLLASSSVAALPLPNWMAAVAVNNVGGVIVLGAVRKGPCVEPWFNAVTTRPATATLPAKKLEGCWGFNHKAGITIDWADHTANDYELADFQWADWVTADTKKSPGGPAPKVEHKSGDIIT